MGLTWLRVVGVVLAAGLSPGTARCRTARHAPTPPPVAPRSTATATRTGRPRLARAFEEDVEESPGRGWRHFGITRLDPGVVVHHGHGPARGRGFEECAQGTGARGGRRPRGEGRRREERSGHSVPLRRRAAQGLDRGELRGIANEESDRKSRKRRSLHTDNARVDWTTPTAVAAHCHTPRRRTSIFIHRIYSSSSFAAGIKLLVNVTLYVGKVYYVRCVGRSLS